jgi:hypothetical protein
MYTKAGMAIPLQKRKLSARVVPKPMYLLKPEAYKIIAQALVYARIRTSLENVHLQTSHGTGDNFKDRESLCLETAVEDMVDDQ